MLKNYIKDILRKPYYKVHDTICRHNIDLLERNQEINSKYKGERCFLVASGESTSLIDLKSLSNEYTFGVGYIMFHPEIEKLKLNFFLASEAGSWMDKKGAHGSHNWPEAYLISNGIDQGKIFLKEVFEKLHSRETTIFLKHDYIKYYQKLRLFDLYDNNVFYLKTINNLHTNQFPTIDLTMRFSSVGGSIFTSMLILMYMGYNEIYLCGAGYTYDPIYELHFYDNYAFPTDIGEDEAVSKLKNIVNSHNKKMSTHLQYSGFWEKNNYYRGIYVKECCEKAPDTLNHKIINEYAKSLGVKIYNIVPHGFESPVYEKITWEEVINEVLPDKQKLV